MAVPKKRTGKAKQATRRANWKGEVPATTVCPNCKETVLTHTVCPNCGYYKDGFASNKNEATVAAAKDVKTVEQKAEENSTEEKTEE